MCIAVTPDDKLVDLVVQGTRRPESVHPTIAVLSPCRSLLVKAIEWERAHSNNSDRSRTMVRSISSSDDAAPIDPSRVAGVRARYRRARADVERSDDEPGEVEPVVESSRILYPKAPLSSRCRASLIDSLIAGVGYVPTFVWFAVTDETTVSTVVLRLLFFAGVAWALYYTFAKDGHAGGQSIGKRQVGLMVVKLATNQPCSRIESGTRTIVMVVLATIPVFGFLIEPIAALAANDGRRLGDRLAGTQVIEVGDYELGE